MFDRIRRTRKEHILIFLLTVFFVFILVFLLVVFKKEQGKRAKKPSQSKESLFLTPSTKLLRPIPQEKTFTAEEISRQTIKFIDKQRKSDGFYKFFAHYEDLCKTEENSVSCPLQGKNTLETANMWPVLARLSFYQNFSRRRDDLVQAEKDGQALIRFCGKERDKCIAVIAPIFKLYQETGNADYRGFLEKMAKELLKDNVDNNVMILSIQARELALLYRLFTDIRYLTLAKRRLAAAKNISGAMEKDQGKSSEAICYIILSETEIAKTLNSKDLAREAAVFLNSDKKDQIKNGPLTLVQPCIESAYELSAFLSDSKLKDLADQMMDKYIIERWDGPDLHRKYQEGGLFLGEGDSPINITDAGYMVYLLGYQPSKSYTFPVSINGKN